MLVFLLFPNVYASEFGSLLDEAKSALQQKDFRQLEKQVKKAKDVLGKSTEIISKNSLSEPWMLRAASSFMQNKEVINDFRSALILNPFMDWDDTYIKDNDTRDLFYAIQTEIDFREKSKTFVPEQHGLAKLYVDGVEVEYGSEVPQGEHLLQIQCPKGEVFSKWHNLAKDPQWIQMCPYTFDLTEAPDPMDMFMAEGIPNVFAEEAPSDTTVEKPIEEPTVDSLTEENTQEPLEEVAEESVVPLEENQPQDIPVVEESPTEESISNEDSVPEVVESTKTIAEEGSEVVESAEAIVEENAAVVEDLVEQPETKPIETSEPISEPVEEFNSEEKSSEEITNHPRLSPTDLQNPDIQKELKTLQKEVHTYWLSTQNAVQANPKLGKSFIRAFIDEFEGTTITVEGKQKRVLLPEVSQAKILYRNYDPSKVQNTDKKIYIQAGLGGGTYYSAIVEPSYDNLPVVGTVFLEGHLYYFSLQLALQGMWGEDGFSNYGAKSQFRIFPVDTFSFFLEGSSSIFYELRLGGGIGFDFPVTESKAHRIRMDLGLTPTYRDLQEKSDLGEVVLKGFQSSLLYMYRF